MASTIENHSDISPKETGEIPEDSNNETGAKDDEKQADNGDENSTQAGRHLDELSNSEIKVDFETGKTDKDESNADEDTVEIVEIEEKLIIETLDEAKNVQPDSLTQNINEGSNVDELTDEVSEKEDDLKMEEAEPEATKKQDEWIDLLGNGLLKKKIVRAGNEGGSRPAAGEEVCVKSEGMLQNGDKVDVNSELKFIIGDGDVIAALDLCIPTMLENEICELMTAPRFAYGTLGREDDDEGDVPPDSDVTYILELLSVKAGPVISNLTDEQKIELGDQKRERGNDLFRREEYSLAVHSYTRALKYLGSSASEAIVDLKVKCWNNISASHLKVQEYVAAKSACDSVLEIDPDNVKALFRKGKVLSAQGEYEESVELLRKANSLDPDNRLIRKELYVVRQKCGENKQKERSMYQRMVSGITDDNTTAEASNTFFTWPVILGITGVAVSGVVAALLFSKFSRH